MRRRRLTRVLGIDPGCRYLGTALIEGGELVHHQVHDLRSSTRRETLAKAGRHIDRLLLAYEPDRVVIEQTFFASGKRAPLLKRVTRRVHSCARASNAVVVMIAPVSLKKRITGNGHASKAEVARAMCCHYPQLNPYLGMRRAWQARYQSNRFDAVALAHLKDNAIAHKLDRRPPTPRTTEARRRGGVPFFL